MHIDAIDPRRSSDRREGIVEVRCRVKDYLLRDPLVLKDEMKIDSDRRPESAQACPPRHFVKHTVTDSDSGGCPRLMILQGEVPGRRSLPMQQ